MYSVIAMEWIRGAGSKYPSRPRPWVARLVGSDPVYKYQREFVRAVYDYTYARKSGGRGIYLYFNLAPGIYEVFEVISWKHDRRYFIRAENCGNWHVITREEIDGCLKRECLVSAS